MLPLPLKQQQRVVVPTSLVLLLLLLLFRLHEEKHLLHQQHSCSRTSRTHNFGFGIPFVCGFIIPVSYEVKHHHHHDHQHFLFLRSCATTSHDDHNLFDTKMNVVDPVVMDNNSSTTTSPTLPSSTKEHVPVPTPTMPYTSALLLISYDGTRFTGWSAGNDNPSSSTSFTQVDDINLSRKKRRRVARAMTAPSVSPPTTTTTRSPGGFVRSVQGVVRSHLAKLYGNIHPEYRVVVEGASRTDKGVHANGMVAQIYCIRSDIYEQLQQEQKTNEVNSSVVVTDMNTAVVTTTTGCDSSRKPVAATATTSTTPSTTMIERSIPGKWFPHPCNSTDSSYFLPLPMSLEKLINTLNRMCFDIRILAVAPVPSITTNNNNNIDDDTITTVPFHASLSAIRKTYRYYFSMGPIHDPIQRRFVWHMDQFDNYDNINDDDDDDSIISWDPIRLEQASQLFIGTHDYYHFQGVPRGRNDKNKYQERNRQRQQVQEEKGNELPKSNTTTTTTNTICTIDSIQLKAVKNQWYSRRIHDTTTTDPQLNKTATVTTTLYEISITGNRFLYKMNRYIVGALIAVGMGQVTYEEIQSLLSLSSHKQQQQQQEYPMNISSSPVVGLEKRKNLFQCAPANGLVLHQLVYGNTSRIDWIYANS